MIERKGVIRGNTVELVAPVGLQEGTAVWVTLQPQLQPSLSLAEKQAILQQLYGAWADDPSIPAIFTEIARARTQATPRSVHFDTP